MESVALTDDGNLCRHIINGINNEIGMKIFNKWPVTGAIVHRQHLYITIGIHPKRPLRHHIRLQAAKRAYIRHKLPIYIGNIHTVLINKNQMPYTCTNECFRRI